MSRQRNPAQAIAADLARRDDEGYGNDLTKAALECLEYPVIICDEHLRIRFRNGVAARLMHCAVYVAQKNHVLLCANGTEQVLRSAVRESIATHLPRTVEIDSKDGHPPVPCRILPLTPYARGAYALLVFESNDPARASTSDPSVLYELTPAEMHVAELLSAGVSARDVCTLRGTTLNTVRTQIKHVLHKTHCRNQVELMALFRQHRPNGRRW